MHAWRVAADACVATPSARTPCARASKPYNIPAWGVCHRAQAAMRLRCVPCLVQGGRALAPSRAKPAVRHGARAQHGAASIAHAQSTSALADGWALAIVPTMVPPFPMAPRGVWAGVPESVLRRLLSVCPKHKTRREPLSTGQGAVRRTDTELLANRPSGCLAHAHTRRHVAAALVLRPAAPLSRRKGSAS